jgi:hypothetical protein
LMINFSLHEAESSISSLKFHLQFELQIFMGRFFALTLNILFSKCKFWLECDS